MPFYLNLINKQKMKNFFRQLFCIHFWIHTGDRNYVGKHAYYTYWCNKCNKRKDFK